MNITVSPLVFEANDRKSVVAKLIRRLRIELRRGSDVSDEDVVQMRQECYREQIREIFEDYKEQELSKYGAKYRAFASAYFFPFDEKDAIPEYAVSDV